MLQTVVAIICQRLKPLIVATTALPLIGCGLVDEVGEQKFKLYMYGVSEQTEGVTGTAAPRHMSFVFNGVSLGRDGGEDVVLGESLAQEVRIINREQIIFEEDLADYDGDTFTSTTVNFGADARMVGKYSEIDIGLESDLTSMVIEDDFTVKPGRGIAVRIRLKWDNFITIDDAAQTDVVDPEIDLEFNTKVDVE